MTFSLSLLREFRVCFCKHFTRPWSNFTCRQANFTEKLCFSLVGPSGLEPPTSCLSGTRSNHLSYEPSFGEGPVAILRRYLAVSFPLPRPFCRSRFDKTCGFFNLLWLRILMRWWRWWDSNPWPPACRAGALPAELHPHILGLSHYPLKRSFKIEQRT